MEKVPTIPSLVTASQRRNFVEQVNESQSQLEETQIKFAEEDDESERHPLTASSSANILNSELKLSKPKRSAIRYPSTSSDEDSSNENKEPDTTTDTTDEVVANVNENNNNFVKSWSFVFASNIDLVVKRSIMNSIEELSGNVANDISSADVLIATLPLSVTINVFLAIASGKPIVTKEFFEKSREAGKWMDPYDFIIKDADLEKRRSFVLKDSILAARTKKLFSDYSVYIYTNLELCREKRLNMANITNLVESAGGEVMKIMSRKKPSRKNVALIYNPDTGTDLKNKLKKFPKALKIYDRDLLWKTILVQKIQASSQSTPSRKS